MKKYQAFIFEDYIFDSTTNKAVFRYSLDGELFFTETIAWQVEATDYSPQSLDSALFSLWIMAGISYYKAYLPKKIVISKGSLSKQQKLFFDKIYTNGLAQFFYTNSLDWKGQIDFPLSAAAKNTPIKSNGVGALVALGGGKDSIVAAELLKGVGIDFSCWVVNHGARFGAIADVLGADLVGVSRTIDPNLVRLNELDAYNGHVPITAIVGFIGVVLAILSGKKSLIWAIESSTDEPNLIWRGLPINHQYSKTSMFEKDMAEYIKSNIAQDIEYYSVLRPFSELRIAKIFCENYLDKYKAIFSSCNANFTVGNASKLGWCGKCPKCAFVFTVFSPFTSKIQLMELFGGKNLFADPELKGTFEQLLGIDGHKPLECVGEIAETRTSIAMSKKLGSYPELSSLKFDEPNYDYMSWRDSFMPKKLQEAIRQYLEPS